MPIRRTQILLCLDATLLIGSPPVGAQSTITPMRTIDIPPSQIEPQESVLPDVTASDRSPGFEGAEPAEASVTSIVGAQPSAEQLALDAIAAAEAAKLREANAAQLSAAQAQLKQITADQSAQRDRLARYREERSAYAAVLSDYKRQLAAVRADHERWQRDVAACRAGDRRSCAARAGPGKAIRNQDGE